MKPASIVACLWAALAAALALPQLASACSASVHEPTPNVRYSPLTDGSTGHWPAETTVDVDTVMSFLVPVDAKVELAFVKKGMADPLRIFGAESHAQMRASTNLSPRWVDIPYDAKKFRWVHIHAASYGIGEIRMSAPSWARQIRVTSYFPSPLDSVRRPVALTLAGGSEARQSVSVDGRDNLEVTVPGNVADGWLVSPVTETGFRLFRILQVWKYGDEPQVKFFFIGTSNPKNATMTLQRMRGEGEDTFRFEIQARPTPLC